MLRRNVFPFSRSPLPTPPRILMTRWPYERKPLVKDRTHGPAYRPRDEDIAAGTGKQLVSAVISQQQIAPCVAINRSAPSSPERMSSWRRNRACRCPVPPQDVIAEVAIHTVVTEL